MNRLHSQDEEKGRLRPSFFRAGRHRRVLRGAFLSMAGAAAQIARAGIPFAARGAKDAPRRHS